MRCFGTMSSMVRCRAGTSPEQYARSSLGAEPGAAILHVEHSHRREHLVDDALEPSSESLLRTVALVLGSEDNSVTAAYSGSKSDRGAVDRARCARWIGSDHHVDPSAESRRCGEWRPRDDALFVIWRNLATPQS